MMNVRRIFLGRLASVGFVALLATTSNPLFAVDDDAFCWSGDFRLRLESDHDSVRESGEGRDDRDRLRLRARLTLDVDLPHEWSGRVRLRSGSDRSQQSPHITIHDFDGNDRGHSHLSTDQWFVTRKHDSGWIRLGRQSLPFWEQNEMLLDQDVTAAGLGARWKRGRLEGNAAYLIMPAGMRDYAGRLAGGQLVYEPKAGSVTWKVAGSMFAFDADRDDADAELFLSGNGHRDYLIAQFSSQWRWRLQHSTVGVGLDLLRNLKDYGPGSDPLALSNQDEDDGQVLSASWVRGAWKFLYRYASIELLAVNASFAEDDWVRWGTADQTRASGLRGYELQVRRDYGTCMNLTVRFYDVDAIHSVEDGRRARIDLNYTPDRCG